VNFAPGSAGRLGLSEDQVRAGRSSAIYSTLNLHSRGGWRESQRGHEHLAEAVTGMSLRYGGDQPVLHPIIVNDHASGHLAAFGILLALLNRRHSGSAQRVETSLSRTSTLHQLPFMIDFPGRASTEPRGRDATGWGPFDRLYRAADGWIYLAAVRLGDTQRLAAIDGLEDAEHWTCEQAQEQLARCFAGQSAEYWQDQLLRVGIAAAVYRDIASLIRDENVMRRGLIVEHDHPGLGRGLGIGVIARFASYPGRAIAPASAPGWHTRQLLDELGLGSRYESLLADGVVCGPYREAVHNFPQATAAAPESPPVLPAVPPLDALKES
jgi:crotonobetainyl-CoA:carnitine CoA-transferase CaiB-like acyl-CoA transferase